MPELDSGFCAKSSDLFIVGGEDAKLQEFPFIALLGFKEEKSDVFGYVCLARLINRKYLVTAAHCIQNKKAEFVVLGEHDTYLKRMRLPWAH